MTDAPRTTASSIAVEWATTGTASLPSRPLRLRSAGSAAEPLSSERDKLLYRKVLCSQHPVQTLQRERPSAVQKIPDMRLAKT